MDIGDTGRETMNMARGGMSSNASCIMSCLRPLTQRASSSSTDVVRRSAKPVKFWTAVKRGLLVQNEMNDSLSSDLVSVLALGDVDPLGRSGLSADAAIRIMHTNLAHTSVPDIATDALGGTSSSAQFGCLGSILVCSV